MSNLLLVGMFLNFTAPSVIFHDYLLACLFTIYGSVFGFIEFIANYYTGDTVSQQIWKLITTNRKQGLMLLMCMLGGWGCWVISLGFVGILNILFTLLMFLALFIPSMLYKEYFLSLASMVFVLCLGFTNSISLTITHQSLWFNLHSLWILHPIHGAIMLVCLVLGWICLLLHLGIKFK
jgi:hypothetical protein